MRRFVLLAALLLPTPAAGQVYQLNAITGQQCDGVGCRQEWSKGTAVCIGRFTSGRWAFLTAAHNVRGAFAAYIVTPAGSVPMQVHQENTADDIAVLSTDRGEWDFAPLGTATPSNGCKVIVSAYRGGELQTWRDDLNTANASCWWLRKRAFQGQSGGGVFAGGKCVAVITSTSKTPGEQWQAACVPLPVIRAYLGLDKATPAAYDRQTASSLSESTAGVGHDSTAQPTNKASEATPAASVDNDQGGQFADIKRRLDDFAATLATLAATAGTTAIKHAPEIATAAGIPLNVYTGGALGLAVSLGGFALRRLLARRKAAKVSAAPKLDFRSLADDITPTANNQVDTPKAQTSPAAGATEDDTGVADLLAALEAVAAKTPTPATSNFEIQPDGTSAVVAEKIPTDPAEVLQLYKQAVRLASTNDIGVLNAKHVAKAIEVFVARRYAKKGAVI